MAGGWSKLGSGIPLADRVRVVGPPEPARAPAREPALGPPVEPCPARHCWVADAIDRHGVKRPGLLIEWRPVASGWEGRVVYAAQLRPDAWLLVEEWLPADLLTPL